MQLVFFIILIVGTYAICRWHLTKSIQRLELHTIRRLEEGISWEREQTLKREWEITRPTWLKLETGASYIFKHGKEPPEALKEVMHLPPLRLTFSVMGYPNSTSENNQTYLQITRTDENLPNERFEYVLEIKEYVGGKMTKEYRIGDGSFSGPWIDYHSSGSVSATLTYSFGEEHGVFRSFYESGHPKITGRFTYGRENGEFLYFFDGQKNPHRKVIYYFGYVLDLIELNQAGEVLERFNNSKRGIDMLREPYYRWFAELSAPEQRRDP